MAPPADHVSVPPHDSRGSDTSTVGDEQHATDPFVLADLLRRHVLRAADRLRWPLTAFALDMAGPVTALITQVARFDLLDPTWTDRDRLVACQPRPCPLIDALGMALQVERGPDGAPGGPIDSGVASGGDGVGHAVGLAMAERLRAARFGRSLVDHRTWVMASDVDLASGTAEEAVALAGMLRLERLTLLVHCGGGAAIESADTRLRRMAAAGWSARIVSAHDDDAIRSALSMAVRSRRPSAIICRTADNPSDAERDATLAAGHVGARAWTATEHWGAIAQRGSSARRGWLKRLARHPLRAEFERSTAKRLPDSWHATMAAARRDVASGTDVSVAMTSQRIAAALAQTLPDLIGSEPFDARALSAVPTWRAAWGPRIAAMGAAANGLASHGGMIPVIQAELGDLDAIRAGLRLAATSGRQIITLVHEPPGVLPGAPPSTLGDPRCRDALAALRAVPAAWVMRPGDAVETAECWDLALRHVHGPSVLVLTRQPLARLRADGPENGCARGGYVLGGTHGPRHATLIASGGELALAMAARDALARDGLRLCVVSLPCWALFAQLDRTARDDVLGSAPRFAIEPACDFGWARWLGEAGVFIDLGLPAPPATKGCVARNDPGLALDTIVAEVKKHLG